jgi:AcrR family transcriptional regulator
MGVKERKQRERSEVREKILDAALEFFATEGVEGVTMRALADAIEYTPPVIYSHFRDKDAIIRELCNRQLRALAKHFGSIAGVADPVERLRGIGRAYVDFALEHPSHFRFMFLTPHPLPPDEDDNLQRGDPREDAYAFLKETAEAAIASGQLRPEFTDAEELSQMCWASTHGVVALQNVMGSDSWVDWRDARTTAHKLLDVTLRGLTREPSRARLTSAPRSRRGKKGSSRG